MMLVEVMEMDELQMHRDYLSSLVVMGHIELAIYCQIDYNYDYDYDYDESIIKCIEQISLIIYNNHE